jgi:phage-related protein
VAKTRKLIVDVLADASKVTSEFGKIGKSSGTLEDKFKKLGKSLALGMGAAAAGVAVLGKGAIDAAVEAQKVQKGVEASIKSSGGAANVTAKEIDKFASAMQFKTGIDDEAIKTSQTLLLGFRNVRNESGDGNKIFNRASVAMLDLGKKMGSTDAAAKALGKALSDPVGGLKGLKGAGVALTEQQKEQVKGFVASGDLLSAQKIVLDEVTKATGGYAESTTTAGDRAKLAFGEVQEKIGGALLPIAEKLSKWFVETLIPAVQSFFKKHGPALKKSFQDIADKIRPVAEWLGENVPKAIKKLGNFIKNNTGEVKVFVGVLGALAVAIGLITIVMNILAMNPIVLIIAGIMIAVAALAAGLFYLYNKFQIVRDIVDTVGTIFKFVFTAIAAYVKWSFEMIKKEIEILAGVFSWLWERTEGLREGIVGIFSGIFDGIKGALRMGWNGLIGIINPIIKKLRGLPGLSWLPAEGLPVWPEDGGGGSQRERRFRNGGVTRFAEGGIVTKPMIGMVGEAGPEAIIPLSKFNGGGSTINITINASPLSSPADVGSAVVDALKAYERRNGSLPLKVA